MKKKTLNSLVVYKNRNRLSRHFLLFFKPVIGFFIKIGFHYFCKISFWIWV